MSRFRALGWAGATAFLIVGACGGSRAVTLVGTSAPTTPLTSTIPSAEATESTSATDTAASVDHSNLTSNVAETGDTNSGWYAFSSTTVLFVSWVEASGQLAGTLEVATLDSTGTKVVPKSIALTGIRSGTQISVNLDDGRRWQGIAGEDKLTLRVPQPDGTIRDIVMQRGGIDNFNRLVTSLQGTAEATQSSVADAKAQADAARQFDNAANELAAAVTNLRTELDHVPAELASYDKAAHKNMVTAVSDVTKSLVARPVDCSDVSYKLSTVDYARSAVDFASTSFGSQLDSVSRAFARLQAAQSALYAISEPDSRSEDHSISDEAVTAAAAAKATASTYDADADAAVRTIKAIARATCPDA